MAQPQPIKTANTILGRFFDKPNPLALENESGKIKHWKLRSDNFSERTQDEKWEYTLWPFPILSEKYPFYLSFSISLEENDDIHDVSIKIFREDVIQIAEAPFIPAQLLLRAEWSNEKSKADSDRVHAQPHWHIHDYRLVDKMEHLTPDDKKFIAEYIDEQSRETSILDDDEDGIAIPPVPTKKELPMFRFHLAMVADWHRENDTLPNKVLDEPILKIWLPQCLEYIKEQLDYIIKKLAK